MPGENKLQVLDNGVRFCVDAIWKELRSKLLRLWEKELYSERDIYLIIKEIETNAGAQEITGIFTSDVSGPWHQGRTETHPQLFQLGANLLLYTTDLAPPKGKLTAAVRPPRPPRPLRTVRIARVKHEGDWNVCPQAASRLSDVLAEALSFGVEEAEPADLAKPVDPRLTLLWMTGTRAGNLPASHRNHLKNYLAAGGTLFVDSAMGGKEFAQAATAMLGDMFGPASLQDLPADPPLLTGAFAGGMGSDLTKVRYTRAAAAEAPPDQPAKLTVVIIDGRVAVVLSPYSVVCGLLAQPTYGCKGLAPPDAARLAANVVLYALAHRSGG